MQSNSYHIVYLEVAWKPWMLSFPMKDVSPPKSKREVNSDQRRVANLRDAATDRFTGLQKDGSSNIEQNGWMDWTI